MEADDRFPSRAAPTRNRGEFNRCIHSLAHDAVHLSIDKGPPSIQAQGPEGRRHSSFNEVKRHSFYLKPGAKRRVKQSLARKRARKKICKESRMELQPVASSQHHAFESGMTKRMESTPVDKSRDQDQAKGAVEQDQKNQGGNTSMNGQLGHRDEDVELKGSDSDLSG
jgi:hypothetical protein